MIKHPFPETDLEQTDMSIKEKRIEAVQRNNTERERWKDRRATSCRQITKIRTEI